MTVERKVGTFNLPSGRAVRVLDLPGTYSLDATSPDEAITRDVVLGKIAGEQLKINAFLCSGCNQLGVPTWDLVLLSH